MLSFHLLWALRGFESNAQSVGKERRFRSFSSSEYCYLVSWQRWFFIVIEILNKVNPPLSWWSARFFTSLENKWKYSYKATATLRFRSVVASLAVQLNALVFQIWNLSDGLKKFKEERKKKEETKLMTLIWLTLTLGHKTSHTRRKGASSLLVLWFSFLIGVSPRPSCFPMM